jgi:hypothetical protein
MPLKRRIGLQVTLTSLMLKNRGVFALAQTTVDFSNG